MSEVTRASSTAAGISAGLSTDALHRINLEWDDYNDYVEHHIPPWWPRPRVRTLTYAEVAEDIRNAKWWRRVWAFACQR